MRIPIASGHRNVLWSRAGNPQVGVCIACGKPPMLHGNDAFLDPLGFPRRDLQGLRDASTEDLQRVEILGPGTAIAWDNLDVGFTVDGSLQGIYGSERWMAELGRAGGSKRSEVKAAAARRNGKQGGRSRKTVSKKKAKTTRAKAASGLRRSAKGTIVKAAGEPGEPPALPAQARGWRYEAPAGLLNIGPSPAFARECCGDRDRARALTETVRSDDGAACAKLSASSSFRLEYEAVIPSDDVLGDREQRRKDAQQDDDRSEGPALQVAFVQPASIYAGLNDRLPPLCFGTLELRPLRRALPVRFPQRLVIRPAESRTLRKSG